MKIFIMMKKKMIDMLMVKMKKLSNYKIKKTKRVSEVEPRVLYENREQPVNRSVNFYDNIKNY